MPNSRFWSMPDRKRKLAVGMLFILILIFLLILVVRSCRKPEGEGPGKYLQNLSSQVPEDRIDAALGLGRIGAKKTVPDLEKAVASDSDERVRRSAAYSILILDREAFLTLLNSPDENIRIIALETISREEKEKAYPYFEKGLSDPSLLVRRASLKLILQVPGSAAANVILQLAERTNEDSSLRIEALSSLGSLAGPELLGRLKDLSGSGTEFAVRAAAGAAVKEIEAKEEAAGKETK